RARLTERKGRPMSSARSRCLLGKRECRPGTQPALREERRRRDHYATASGCRRAHLAASARRAAHPGEGCHQGSRRLRRWRDRLPHLAHKRPRLRAAESHVPAGRPAPLRSARGVAGRPGGLAAGTDVYPLVELGALRPIRRGPVKTLHTAYRVTDLTVSLDFYSALGYREVGRVGVGEGASLTMLKFPGEEVVTLELVHRPADGPVQVGTGFSHLVVQVDELAATIEALAQGGLQPGPEQHPAGPVGPRTSWLTDPDGYRIELVQWTPGHRDGISAADFA